MFEAKSESVESESEKSKNENLAEDIVSPELLTEQKISEMKSGLVEIEKDGAMQMESANDSTKLGKESVVEIKEAIGVEEKLSDIASRAKELFKTAQSAMKKSIVIGMTTMAFSGTALASENKVYDNSGERAQSMEKNDSNENESRMIAAEKAKYEIKKHVASQEYLDRLKIECEGNIEKAVNIQKERLDYLTETEIRFVRDSDKRDECVSSDYDGIIRIIPNRLKNSAPKWLLEMMTDCYRYDYNAFYSPERKTVIFSDSDQGLLSDAGHEFFHASTHGNDGITGKAKKILEDSYIERPTGSGGRSDNYLKNISERLARKQELDLEMEKLGIKKYGEKFTKEHYNKLVEIIEEHEGFGLSRYSQDFIMTTKPEYFEKIFNEIASTELASNNSSADIA